MLDGSAPAAPSSLNGALTLSSGAESLPADSSDSSTAQSPHVSAQASATSNGSRESGSTSKIDEEDKYHIICLGIGKITDSREAQYQFIQLESLAERFNVSICLHLSGRMDMRLILKLSRPQTSGYSTRCSDRQISNSSRRKDGSCTLRIWYAGCSPPYISIPS